MNTLQRIALGLVGVNIGIIGQWAMTQNDLARAAIEPYGAGQCLTAQQIITAHHLAFPQSYSAITSALGSPEAMDRERDWYCLPNSRQFLVVSYNREGRAIALGYSQ